MAAALVAVEVTVAVAQVAAGMAVAGVEEEEAAEGWVVEAAGRAWSTGWQAAVLAVVAVEPQEEEAWVGVGPAVV